MVYELANYQVHASIHCGQQCGGGHAVQQAGSVGPLVAADCASSGMVQDLVAEVGLSAEALQQCHFSDSRNEQPGVGENMQENMQVSPAA